MPVFTAAAIVLLVTGAAIYAVIVYNGLVRLQNEIGRAWANIDVLLKQRHDEIGSESHRKLLHQSMGILSREEGDGGNCRDWEK